MIKFMILLDGKKTSNAVEKSLKKELSSFKDKIKLNVILIGDNPASVTYVHMKKKKCLELDIECEVLRFDKRISQNELLDIIDELNKNDKITGILVQLPLPEHIDSRKVLDRVDIKKDVDGLNSYNLMKILLNQKNIIPCTPKGIIRLLEEYHIDLEGKKVCIIGFSDVVGKPLATICLNKYATVTVCHIKTKNLKEHTLSADIIMTATGVNKIIKRDMIKEGVVIIDIGISKIDGNVVGDVDFNNVKDKCSFITPVPGGVGPMTIISLIENLIELKKKYC